MSDPSGWIREPYAASARLERLDEQRQLVGRRRHVGVGEHDVVAVGRGACRHGRPRPCRRAAPSAARARRRRAPVARGRARPWRRSSRRRRRARGPRRELGGAGPAVAGVGPAPVEVAEQLVEGRSEAGLLVVGRQDDGQRANGHVGSLLPRARHTYGTAGWRAAVLTPDATVRWPSTFSSVGVVNRHGRGVAMATADETAAGGMDRSGLHAAPRRAGHGLPAGDSPGIRRHTLPRASG